MMDIDRLTLVQPQGRSAITPCSSAACGWKCSMPIVLMYTLAYFCLTNTLSAISIWTPQILKSFN